MKTMNIAEVMNQIKERISNTKLTAEEIKTAKRLNELYVRARNSEDVLTEMVFTDTVKLLSSNYKEMLEYVRDVNFLDLLEEVAEEDGTCKYIDMDVDEWYYLEYDDTTYAVHYDALDPYFDLNECCTKKF